MLVREQAIDIIQTYVNKDNHIVFPYSFPLELIPNEARDCEDWEFEMLVDINKTCFINSIRYGVNQIEGGSQVVEQTDNEIVFMLNRRITFDFYINKLNTLQKEFDLKDDGNMELAEYIKYTNEIKELEYFLIDNAEVILKAKDLMDEKINDEKNKLTDKELWIL